MDSVHPTPARARLGRWSVRELLLTVGIGLGSGLFLAPLLTAVLPVMHPARTAIWLVMITAGSGVFFVPSFWTACLVRRPGAAVLVQGGVALITGSVTPFGINCWIAGGVYGLIAECATAGATRYRSYRPTALVGAGSLAGGICIVIAVVSPHPLDQTLPVVSGGGVGTLGRAISAALLGYVLAGAGAHQVAWKEQT